MSKSTSFDIDNPRSGMTRAELTQMIRLMIGADAMKRATIRVEDTHAEGPLRGHGGGIHVTFAAVPPGSSEIDALNAPNFMLSIDAPEWHQVATINRGTPDAIVHKVTLRQFRGRTKIKGRTGYPIPIGEYVAKLVREHAGLPGRISGKHLGLDEKDFERIDKRAVEIRQAVKRLRDRDKPGRASGAHLGKHIGHSFYKITDKQAAALARAAGAPLPRHGYYIPILLEGRRAELHRTTYSSSLHTDAPKRGWVWAVLDPHRR